jgi:hypothetical protein
MASGSTSAHDDADSSGVWSDLARDHLRPLLKLNDTLRTLSGLESDINVTTIVAVCLPLHQRVPGFIAKAAIPKNHALPSHATSIVAVTAFCPPLQYTPLQYTPVLMHQI